ncbi:MAG: fumarate hydratase, partial [Spirochaetes bacterium]|nr:fumarate hydratase [Spirochaetota bacterium]
MREISFDEIVSKIESLCLSANVNLADGIVDCYQKALKTEESDMAKSIISDCIENHKIASEEKVPLCQDTGLAVFFIKVGDEIRIKDGLLSDAVTKGVSLGYTRGYLRASCLDDPLYDRKNTRDNTPPIIHTEIVSGDKLEITFIPKGGGAENMSAL